MSKKRGLEMEWVPHDVVEIILETLEVKSLVKFKAVSKQWKSTIESPLFQAKHLKQRQQLRDPDVLMVYLPDRESLRTLVLGSSSSVKFPIHWDKDMDKDKEYKHYFVSYHSCDGLVCLYHPLKSGIVLNPATRWYRHLPLCQFQRRMIDLGDRHFKLLNQTYNLGFGKDIFTGKYKAVWLYNNNNNNNNSSKEIGVTTCEVFDFSTNAWRYVTPSAPHGIVGAAHPVFANGSLHWFTDCWQETKVVSFDLHTETFQIISKAPLAYVHFDHYEIVLCNLDNRLCVSEKIYWSNQVIWSFDSVNKTWDKICSIDLRLTRALYGCPTQGAFHPLALLAGSGKNNNNKKKKKNLLFHDPTRSRTLWTHDLETESDHVAFNDEYYIGYRVCYFQSLISI